MKALKKTFLSLELIITVITALLLLTFPFYISKFFVFLISLALIMSVFALSFNMLLGYMGKLSFGHAAYFGLGAFFLTIGMTTYNLPYPIAVLFALSVTLAVAAVLGYIVVRLRDIYFALFTLAIAAVFEYMTTSFKFFGGADGLPVPYITSLTNYYYFIVVVVFICIYILFRITQSPFGEVLKAIKDNTERVWHIGVSVTKFQWINWMIACFFAGVAGVLAAPLLGHVGPDIIGVEKSTEAVVMTILGGMNTFVGPIVGAFFLVLIKEWFSSISIHWMLILGGTLLIIVLFFPHGIAGYGETLIKRTLQLILHVHTNKRLAEK